MKSTAKEQWRPVSGFEGHYEVSDLGRVRSLDRLINRRNGTSEFKRGRILKQAKAGRGYLFVSLAVERVCRQTYVHRLVASAFVLHVSGPHVNHIDFNRENNAASNLEWVTPKRNTEHSIRAGRWADIHANKRILAAYNPKRAQKLTLATVEAIRSACQRGESQFAIGARFGITQATVSKIKRGSIWTDTVRSTALSQSRM